MRKSIILLFIGFVIISSCKTKSFQESKIVAIEAQEEVNYIPYYLKVYEAKKYYDFKEYNKSFIILDSLFKHFEPIETPTVYEMDIYCELAVILEKYNINVLKKVLRTKVLKYGRKPYLNDDLDSFWKKVIIYSNYKKSDFEKFHNEYLSNINYGLKDTIVEVYKRDQLYRKKSDYNTAKFDSIDKINSKIILAVIKKHGYPRENLIGGLETSNPAKPNYLSTALMHLDFDIYKLELDSLLFNEVKKGNLCPLDYAMMNDRIYVANKDKMSNYVYFGTYKNIKIQDTLKTNNARKLIGLPSL